MVIFNVAYVLLNGFWCYILHMFMGVFFVDVKTRRTPRLLSYALYCAGAVFLYFAVGSPAILGLFNLAGCFLLTFHYSSTIVKRLLATLIIFATETMTEVAVAIICGYFKFTAPENFTIELLHKEILLQLVVSRLALFMIARIARNCTGIKRGVKISPYNWIAVTILPAFSVYIGLLIFNTGWINETTLTIGIAGILLLNFAAFYLYDAIIGAQAQKIRQTLLTEQNQSYEKQFLIMKDSIFHADLIRHDFKHHLAVIADLVKSNKNTACFDYISKLVETEYEHKSIVHSGNAVVDSILNFKLQTAAKHGAVITSNVRIPDDLSISPADMTIILGNLIDNAVEATLKRKDAGSIDILIKETKGRVFIKLSNAFDGNIEQNGETLLTGKPDKTNHGLGLESVRRAVAKYDGELTLDFTDTTFSAVVLLYL